jgi:hypothetical protein
MDFRGKVRRLCFVGNNNFLLIIPLNENRKGCYIPSYNFLRPGFHITPTRMSFVCFKEEILWSVRAIVMMVVPMNIAFFLEGTLCR